jgi:hypothetical protein
MGRSDPNPPFDRSLLAREAPLRHLPGRNFTKADVLVYRLGDELVAIKDYAPRPAWVRHTLGRWLIRREALAYRAASGIDGLPRFRGRAGRFALALEFVDAVPLAERSGPALGEAFFDRLDSLVGAFHQRGIALGDLHQRDVLIGSDGAPRIVDLATAWVSEEGSWRWRRAIFHRLADLDRIATARMRARWTGRDVEEASASIGSPMVKWHARGRRLKRLWDRARGARRTRARGDSVEP